MFIIPSVLKKDRQLRNCKDGRWKKSFPDLDYAMLGYDLVRGYPLATGHDPGFTHPIFTADYSTKQQTTDCRYSVPKGLVVVPDVSCVTSFASKLVRSKVEMSETLEAAANVGGIVLFNLVSFLYTAGLLVQDQMILIKELSVTSNSWQTFLSIVSRYTTILFVYCHSALSDLPLLGVSESSQSPSQGLRKIAW